MGLEPDSAHETLALSIRQPWAELILCGRKTIELRRWETTYRGTLWLHASREPDRGASEHFAIGDCFVGGFVGAVRLRDCVSVNAETWSLWSYRHLAGRVFHPNYWGWLLEEPIRFSNPIPAAGRLRLFPPPPELATLLHHALAGARSRRTNP